MGLIKAAKEAITSELGDQFLTMIRCDNMDNNLLMKKVTREDGIIPNGSRIIVAPGQVVALYDNGKILDATAEEGVYTFETQAAPSFFGGDFGSVFKDMWDRFKFGGAAAKEQAVFFFNVKEILGNKFGTPNPVPYKDWGHPLTNPRTNSLMPMSVEIKCFGTYTFQIADPAQFMSRIAGSAEEYTKEELVEQMRAEVIGTFSNVLNSLCEDAHKVEALSLPNQTDEIKAIMEEFVFDEPIRNRGIKIVSFVVESVTLDEESKVKIDQYELGSDAFQQKATLTEAYANAIQDAANNKSGSMNGFLGVGMTNMATGGVFNVLGNQNIANTGAVPTQMPPTMPQGNTWKCTCGAENTGKFCSECGKPKDIQCPKCKHVHPSGTKFCSECGEKLV